MEDHTDHTCNNTHDKELCCNLRHIIAFFHNTPDYPHNGNSQCQQDQNVSDTERMSFVDPCFFILITEILIGLICNRNRRCLLHFCRIEHRHSAAESGKYHPHHHTESRTGKYIDTGNTLRDTHRKRVHPGCTETDLCCHISNQNGNDRVISNGNKQWAQDHGKWKRFLSHSKNCSSKRKQYKQYRNQQFFCSLCLADQSDQSRFDRACPNHDTKCTTNYQQKCNDLDRRITDNSIKHVIKESAFAVTAE